MHQHYHWHSAATYVFVFLISLIKMFLLIISHSVSVCALNSMNQLTVLLIKDLILFVPSFLLSLHFMRNHSESVFTHHFTNHLTLSSPFLYVPKSINTRVYIVIEVIPWFFYIFISHSLSQCDSMRTPGYPWVSQHILRMPSLTPRVMPHTFLFSFCSGTCGSLFPFNHNALTTSAITTTQTLTSSFFPPSL